ncbi:MAG: hypothetical protein J0H88_08455 [Sphingomonadales bacterium]|nr:hypothetical protein [Sphingomonadales bacterium]
MVSVEEKLAADGLISFKDVERAMVEMIELWRRSPGSGRGSPWAADAPWDMGDQPLYGPDVDKDVPLRPAPLTRAEVAVRDAISGWHLLVVERDRRLVILGVNQMSRYGYQSPKFKELRAAMGVTLGADGLRMRYNRAVSAIAQYLNCNATARKAAGLRT